MTNSAVKGAAQAALDVAKATGNQNLVDAVQGILGESASGNGTAIFYSGKAGANYKLAKECKLNELGSANSYIWEDTDAGQYAKGVASSLGTSEQDALERVASAMMGAEAKGPTIAFVNGATSTSDWIAAELPAMTGQWTRRDDNGATK